MKTIFVALIGASFAWLLRFALKFHSHRRQYAKLPGPPHSYWLGHLQIVDKMLKELPPNTHMQVVVAHMGQTYGLKDAWYIDMWPAAPPFMVIANSDIAQQLTVANHTPKHKSNKEFLGNMVGDRAISTLEGQQWKETLCIMCDRLSPLAGQDSAVRLQEFFTDMTIDVIGHATIGVDLKAQTTGSPIAQAFKKSVKLSAEQIGDPLARYRKGLQLWWYTRKITQEVKKVVTARWYETKSEKAPSKLAIDLLFGAVRDGNPVMSVSGARDLDTDALNISTDQVKTLLLGGHDTSSALLCYAICLISQDSEVLARIRSEHSDLVPPSATRDEAVALLNSNPSRVNNLAYTTAVIKETLRLFPTSSTARTVTPDSPFQTIKTPRNPDQELPLGIGGQIIWITGYMVHHNPDHFSDPFDFIPDRFIPESEYALSHPFPSHAWRPFEKGPRACIGTELAMVEMRLALVMFFHEFEVEVAYEKDAPKVPNSLGGVQWYQIMEFAAKPVGGMPVKLKKRIPSTR